MPEPFVRKMLNITWIALSILAGQRLIIFVHACTTARFAALYDPYPDCARPCLACPDADYTHNFAKTCNYESGDCCLSQQHLSIAETWACVRETCKEGSLAQKAFDTFVQRCKEKGKPLNASDVPTGYGAEGAAAIDGRLALLFPSYASS